MGTGPLVLPFVVDMDVCLPVFQGRRLQASTPSPVSGKVRSSLMQIKTRYIQLCARSFTYPPAPRYPIHRSPTGTHVRLRLRPRNGRGDETGRRGDGAEDFGVFGFGVLQTFEVGQVDGDVVLRPAKSAAEEKREREEEEGKAHLVGEGIRDVRDVLVLGDNVLAHLVHGRLHARALVRRKDLERGGADRGGEVFEVDAEVGERSGGERGRREGDGVGAVDRGGEDPVVDFDERRVLSSEESRLVFSGKAERRNAPHL